MTNLHLSTRRKRYSSLLVAACIVSVWLLGAGAALSSSIYTAKHACCHQQELAGSCLTLCASANWTATVSADQTPVSPALDVVWNEALQPAAGPSGVLATVSAVNHSPPLYLQHSSLLI